LRSPSSISDALLAGEFDFVGHACLSESFKDVLHGRIHLRSLNSFFLFLPLLTDPPNSNQRLNMTERQAIKMSSVQEDVRRQALGMGFSAEQVY
jgi:hypothetical protein